MSQVCNEAKPGDAQFSPYNWFSFLQKGEIMGKQEL